jgi:hypothetical protein
MVAPTTSLAGITFTFIFRNAKGMETS